jgi:hypothetical protein
MTNTITFKMIGITDETTVCECCGKTNLKKVVVLENINTGEIVRYGVDCAAKAQGTKTAKKEINCEFELRAKINGWVVKGVNGDVIAKALSNLGYGGEFRNGTINCRGLSTPIVL